MNPSIRWLDEQNEHTLLVVPNAGMPENQGGKAVYKMTPEKMSNALGDFLDQYKKVRIIGGCCGTNPEHIKALRKVIDEKANSLKG
jgi:5-methyltetrahydrofolate--homocysteine methyltransferase